MLIRKDRNIAQRSGEVLQYIPSKVRYQTDLSNDIEKLFVKIVFNGHCFVIGVSYKCDLSYKYYIDELVSSIIYIR